MCSNLFFHTKYIRLSQVGFGHVFGVWDGVFGMWDNVLVFGFWIDILREKLHV